MFLFFSSLTVATFFNPSPKYHKKYKIAYFPSLHDRTIRRSDLNPSDKLYIPLDHARNEIRLLVIYPAKKESDDIVCSLRQVSLAFNPSYDALSYAWDHHIARNKSPTPCTINVNDHRIQVTPNFECAIRHLRKPDSIVVLWADCICINQNDLEEQAHQVSLMRSIYSQAKRTFIWLGPTANESDKAMDFITSCDSIDIKDPSFNFESIETPSRALEHLFSRTWWSRIWVVQEAFLSSDVIVLCGHKEARLDSFVRLASKENYVRRTITHSHVSNWTFMPPQTPFYTVLLKWPDMQEKMRGPSLGLTLWEALQITGPFHSSKPRDKIYGLLGLVTPSDSEAIMVDYSRLTDREISIEAFAHIVQANNNIQPLQYAQSHPRSSEFPSWVPNLTNLGYNMPLPLLGFSASPNSLWSRLNRRLYGRMPLTNKQLSYGIGLLIMVALFPRVNKSLLTRVAAATVDGDSNGYNFRNPPFHTRYNKDEKALIARGIRLDEVAYADPAPNIGVLPEYTDLEVISVPLHAQPESYHALLSAVLRWRQAFSSYPNSPYPTKLHRSDAFRRTLITNQYFETDNGVFKSSIAPKGYDLSLDFWCGDWDPPRWSEKVLLDVRRYQATVGLVTTYRSFIITKSGYIGLAPAASVPGDLVCILQGGEVPFILRARENGRWEVIGGCYVHGVMNGEHVNRAGLKDACIYPLV